MMVMTEGGLGRSLGQRLDQGLDGSGAAVSVWSPRPCRSGFDAEHGCWCGRGWRMVDTFVAGSLLRRRRYRRWSAEEKRSICREGAWHVGGAGGAATCACLFSKRLERGRFVWPAQGR